MKYFIITFVILFVAITATAKEITVEMLNKRASDNASMVYSEDISFVDVGDTINWIATTKNHNVHFLAGPEGWTPPKMSALNKDYSYTFEVPGIYYYECTPHKKMGMIALVVVGGDTSNKDIISKVKVFGKSKPKLKKLLKSI